jgi:hypothetical protein
MPYYPETTVIQGLAHVIRDRRLPKEVVPRVSHLVAGTDAEAMHVVLEGEVLREYRIFDVAAALKERDLDRLAAMLEVGENERVRAGQELARRGRGRRGRVLLSPANGLVVRIHEGRSLQISERSVEVQGRPARSEKWSRIWSASPAMARHAVRVGQRPVLPRGVPLFAAGWLCRPEPVRPAYFGVPGRGDHQPLSDQQRRSDGRAAARGIGRRRAEYAVQLARICIGAYIPSIVDRRFWAKTPNCVDL